MSNKNLQVLLTEYEQKRRKAEMDLNDRKHELYKKFPRLEEIDTQINKIAINKTKAILKRDKVDNLENEILKLKEEKENILKKENIDISFFKPTYECDFCEDTGYVLDENNKTIQCSCLKQNILNNLYNKSNLSNIDKENFNNFNENIFSDKVISSRIHPHENLT